MKIPVIGQLSAQIVSEVRIQIKEIVGGFSVPVAARRIGLILQPCLQLLPDAAKGLTRPELGGETGIRILQAETAAQQHPHQRYQHRHAPGGLYPAFG